MSDVLGILKGEGGTAMTIEVAGNADTLRREIRYLFGLSWDRFVEWSLIAWLAAWIWTAWAVSNALVFPTSGPVAWIADVCRSIGVVPFDWLLALEAWLSATERGPLLPVAVIAAAASATLAARSYELTGLRVLALIATVVAVEINGSVLPIAWIALAAAVPYVMALVVCLVSGHDSEDRRFWTLRSPSVATRRFLLRVMALFALPIGAPVVLSIALVESYSAKRSFRPTEDLAQLVAHEFANASTNHQRIADTDPLTAASLIVAAVTSTSTSSSSRAVADHFEYQMDKRRSEPTGALRTMRRPSGVAAQRPDLPRPRSAAEKPPRV